MTKILFDGLGNPKPISDDVNADLEAENISFKQRIAMYKTLIEELTALTQQLRHELEEASIQCAQREAQLNQRIKEQEEQITAHNLRFDQATRKIDRINRVKKEYAAKIKALEHQLDYEYLKKKRREVTP